MVAQNPQTMTYNPNKHHRRSVRLKGYDYSQTGLYYITICVQNRACLFGKIENGNMILNDAGHMIENEWLKLTERFKNIVLHEYVIMPNHFHAILEIVGTNVMISQNNTTIRNENGEPNLYAKGQPQGIAPTNGKTVGDMIGAFCSITTVEYIRSVKNNNWQPFDKKIWQRNYWEHIIRDGQSHEKILEYIITNPENWNNDTLYQL